jgi:hypothetical protein
VVATELKVKRPQRRAVRRGAEAPAPVEPQKEPVAS